MQERRGMLTSLIGEVVAVAPEEEHWRCFPMRAAESGGGRGLIIRHSPDAIKGKVC